MRSQERQTSSIVNEHLLECYFHRQISGEMGTPLPSPYGRRVGDEGEAIIFAPTSDGDILRIVIVCTIQLHVPFLDEVSRRILVGCSLFDTTVVRHVPKR